MPGTSHTLICPLFAHLSYNTIPPSRSRFHLILSINGITRKLLTNYYGISGSCTHTCRDNQLDYKVDLGAV